MRVEVKMPRMGQSMEEGTLLSWLKPLGERVKAGEPLVEIETDKATIEIEAFATGTLVEVLVQTGETVPVGTVLGFIEKAGSKSKSTTSSTPAPKLKPARILASPVAKRLAKENAFDLSARTGSGPDGLIIKRDIDAWLATALATPRQSERLDISPVARRLANEHQIDLTTLSGTGPNGRIIKRDIEAHLASVPAPQVETPVEAVASETEQPLSKIKQATARLMVESKTTIPHFYVSIEIDMGQSLSLRQALKKRGHRISVNDLILKAVAVTLADYPSLNATLDGDALQLQPHIHLALAVALMENERPTGLITPIVSHCETLSLLEIAEQSNAVIERARNGRLRGQDLLGGTFTVSNLGMFEVKHFEAIVNPPQACILAVGAIRRVPMFDDYDNVVPTHLMTATLSADHRMTDGAEVASFMRDLKDLLEEGYGLLMS